MSETSAPIRLTDGPSLGLYAIDPEPHRLKTLETIQMFEFADGIGFQLSDTRTCSTNGTRPRSASSSSPCSVTICATLWPPLLAAQPSPQGGFEQTRRANSGHDAGQRRPDVGPDRQRSGLRARPSRRRPDAYARGRGRLGANLATGGLQQVVGELRIGAAARTIETDFVLPDRVNCDPSRFGQMVSNLLANVSLTARRMDPSEFMLQQSAASWKCRSPTAAPPITPATRERLFQPFFRGEAQPSQNGLGLGLHIASEIAKAHAGAIEVASTPQETRFTFRMPLNA